MFQPKKKKRGRENLFPRKRKITWKHTSVLCCLITSRFMFLCADIIFSFYLNIFNFLSYFLGFIALMCVNFTLESSKSIWNCVCYDFSNMRTFLTFLCLIRRFYECLSVFQMISDFNFVFKHNSLVVKSFLNSNNRFGSLKLILKLNFIDFKTTNFSLRFNQRFSR